MAGADDGLILDNVDRTRVSGHWLPPAEHKRQCNPNMTYQYNAQIQCLRCLLVCKIPTGQIFGGFNNQWPHTQHATLPTYHPSPHHDTDKAGEARYGRQGTRTGQAGQVNKACKHAHIQDRTAGQAGRARQGKHARHARHSGHCRHGMQACEHASIRGHTRMVSYPAMSR